MTTSVISKLLKERRRKWRMTQPVLAKKAGVGLHFIRDLEQGKETVCLKKLNQVMLVFQFEMYPCSISSHHPYSPPKKSINWKDIDDPEKTRGDKDCSFLNL
jgi:DNA-binding XRE family transcriptional regulator